jgi:phosphotransferase system enzyme I (PtsI)
VSTAVLAIQGLPVSHGFGIGRAVVMDAASLEVSHYLINDGEVESECERLVHAFDAAREELAQLAAGLPPDAPPELGAFLHVHSLILADSLIADVPLQLIRERHYNAEWALVTQGQLLAEQFAAMEDEYLSERAADVRQVIERVLQALAGSTHGAFSPLANAHGSDPLIVVAHDISPADMIKLREGRFAGFATDLGGATSHTAIVARSLGVPAVVALGTARSLVRDGDALIVDGEAGVLIVNPSEALIAEYVHRQMAQRAEQASLNELVQVPAITRDGVRISLEANIELPEEAESAVAAGAEGIGLFRSEFLFMGRSDLPGEEEQYEAYSQVVRTMAGRPVTIRTLDVGADKALDTEASVAINPALGLRAIRYCLANPEMFGAQLRAILRASAHGPIRLLIPMVAHQYELDATFAAILAAREQLEARGQPFSPELQVGAMIEVPAAAIAIEPFVERLDFLSIGTNDLIQYTLAIDRADPEVADLYDPVHPAVLRLISQTITAGARMNKPVSVCGEMAGDLRLTRLLLGLGLTHFSMNASQLLRVKREVLGARVNALRPKVAAVLNRATPVDLMALAQD